jgi:hypothetical protein
MKTYNNYRMGIVDETTQNENGNAPAEQEAGKNKKGLWIKIGAVTGLTTVVGGSIWLVRKKFFGKKDEAKQADGFENPDKK